jgi:hypothetical protein
MHFTLSGFVQRLTDQGWLSVLIPEELGGGGLGITEAGNGPGVLAGEPPDLRQDHDAGSARRGGDHAPDAWKRLPIRKPRPAAPRPIASIFSPLLRQSPTSVTAE